MKTFVTLNI